jgi:hypothetical protein
MVNQDALEPIESCDVPRLLPHPSVPAGTRVEDDGKILSLDCEVDLYALIIDVRHPDVRVYMQPSEKVAWHEQFETRPGSRQIARVANRTDSPASEWTPDV